ncbi:hypothetical protein SS50377_22996 [Spironucleus salmonicida]|uniref:Uncharacterized protein n=1 Tax=Spironucleus salmonicida TaxID=348837 RepID=V6LTJ9_9EUKA|nr:hypothetical protein SS50377_22996 [Spironucleus salmonicida]|eukprot:EST47578.1 hypothetical protein SS50377_12269 [Spironucleus salmonicida]
MDVSGQKDKILDLIISAQTQRLVQIEEFLRNRPFYLLNEPQLGCDGLTDHLNPKFLTPLFANLLANKTAFAHHEGVAAIFQSIQDSVDAAAASCARNAKAQNNEIDALKAQIGSQNDHIARISKQLGAFQAHARKLQQQKSEQGHQQRIIGKIYQTGGGQDSGEQGWENRQIPGVRKTTELKNVRNIMQNGTEERYLQTDNWEVSNKGVQSDNRYENSLNTSSLQAQYSQFSVFQAQSAQNQLLNQQQFADNFGVSGQETNANADQLPTDLIMHLGQLSSEHQEAIMNIVKKLNSDQNNDSQLLQMLNFLTKSEGLQLTNNIVNEQFADFKRQKVPIYGSEQIQNTNQYYQILNNQNNCQTFSNNKPLNEQNGMQNTQNIDHNWQAFDPPGTVKTISQNGERNHVNQIIDLAANNNFQNNSIFQCSFGQQFPDIQLSLSKNSTTYPGSPLKSGKQSSQRNKLTQQQKTINLVEEALKQEPYDCLKSDNHNNITPELLNKLKAQNTIKTKSSSNITLQRESLMNIPFLEQIIIQEESLDNVREKQNLNLTTVPNLTSRVKIDDEKSEISKSVIVPVSKIKKVESKINVLFDNDPTINTARLLQSVSKSPFKPKQAQTVAVLKEAQKVQQKLSLKEAQPKEIITIYNDKSNKNQALKETKNILNQYADHNKDKLRQIISLIKEQGNTDESYLSAQINLDSQCNNQDIILEIENQHVQHQGTNLQDYSSSIKQSNDLINQQNNQYIAVDDNHTEMLTQQDHLNSDFTVEQLLINQDLVINIKNNQYESSSNTQNNLQQNDENIIIYSDKPGFNTSQSCQGKQKPKIRLHSTQPYYNIDDNQVDLQSIYKTVNIKPDDLKPLTIDSAINQNLPSHQLQNYEPKKSTHQKKIKQKSKYQDYSNLIK